MSENNVGEGVMSPKWAEAIARIYGAAGLPVPAEVADRQHRADVVRLTRQVEEQAIMIQQYRGALSKLEATVGQLTRALVDERAKFSALVAAAARPALVEGPEEFPSRALRFSR